jgi:hypothetical protein
MHRDPLGNWVWLHEVFGTPEGAHNPWWTSRMERCRNR